VTDPPFAICGSIQFFIMENDELVVPCEADIKLYPFAAKSGRFAKTGKCIFWSMCRRTPMTDDLA
jgi:hypothetical protein